MDVIYLDNHATTRCDPAVVEAMLPWLSEAFGNPHSPHSIGQQAKEAIEQSLELMAKCLGANSDSVVMTSGATESNNLAIRGFCTHPRQKRRKIVTVTTEHPAVLDVCDDLAREGFEIVVVPVHPAGDKRAGIVQMDRLEVAIDDQTALVSVMWANNEIGAIAPMKEIADLCHRQGAILHSDATQAVGRLPVDVRDADIDLLSATGHKLYGPKGTGLLVVGNGNRRVRLRPLIVGGGQQRGLRSGTMNPAGIVGLATAMQLADQTIAEHRQHVRALRNELWQRLTAEIAGLQINGPVLDGDSRLPGNLNLMLPDIEGQAWMSAVDEVAFSSGSACSGAEAKPSHVLTSLGLSDSEARRCVRFGLGRFNTAEQIEQASRLLLEGYRRVEQMV